MRRNGNVAAERHYGHSYVVMPPLPQPAPKGSLYRNCTDSALDEVVGFLASTSLAKKMKKNSFGSAQTLQLCPKCPLALPKTHGPALELHNCPRYPTTERHDPSQTFRIGSSRIGSSWRGKLPLAATRHPCSPHRQSATRTHTHTYVLFTRTRTLLKKTKQPPSPSFLSLVSFSSRARPCVRVISSPTSQQAPSGCVFRPKRARTRRQQRQQHTPHDGDGRLRQRGAAAAIVEAAIRGAEEEATSAAAATETHCVYSRHEGNPVTSLVAHLSSAVIMAPRRVVDRAGRTIHAREDDQFRRDHALFQDARR